MILGFFNWKAKLKSIYGVFVYSSSYVGYDGNEGVGFPSIFLYVGN